VVAVAGGGIGTLLVVLAVALIWPEMRNLGAMSGVERKVPGELQGHEKAPLP
jgi:hypothetical protein